MPANQPTYEHAANDYSEDVDYILSSLPKWLKKWNIYIIVIVTLGCLLIYQLFEKRLHVVPVFTTLNVYPAPQNIRVKNLSKVCQLYPINKQRVTKGDTIAKISELGNPSQYFFLIAPITGVPHVKGDFKTGSILRQNQILVQILAEEERAIYGELRMNAAQAGKFKPGDPLKIELEQENSKKWLDARVQQIDFPNDSASVAIIYYQIARSSGRDIKPGENRLRGKLVQEQIKFSISNFL